MKKIFLLIMMFFCLHCLESQKCGDRDLSFGINGIVKTDWFGKNDGINSIICQEDGKIVAGGFAYRSNNDDVDFAIARFNQNGNLDTSFGLGGKVVTDFYKSEDRIYAMDIQTNNKIIVAGYVEYANANDADFSLARYNINGSLDSSFGKGGKVTLDFNGSYDGAYSIISQSDGKIIVGGFATDFEGRTSDIAIARFNVDGSLDETFGVKGKLTRDFKKRHEAIKSMILQADGRILVGGYIEDSLSTSTIVARYNPDGSLDSTFGIGGLINTDTHENDNILYAMDIQSDGKILSGGSIFNDKGDVNSFYLKRFNTNGSIDNTFGNDGVVVTNFGGAYQSLITDLGIQSDGKILATGWVTKNFNEFPKFGVARFNIDGSLDSNGFGNNGYKIDDLGPRLNIPYALAIDNQSNIIIGGCAASSNGNFQSDMAIMRFISSCNLGTIDFSNVDTMVIYPNPIVDSFTLEYYLSNAMEIQIYLMDMNGRKLANLISKQFQDKGYNRQNLFLPANLPSGTYLIYLESNYGVKTVKIIK